MPVVLGVDFGTSHTVAALRMPDGRTESLLFDASPLLPSAVFAQPDGQLLVGHDALRGSRLDPGRLEPNPSVVSTTGLCCWAMSRPRCRTPSGRCSPG